MQTALRAGPMKPGPRRQPMAPQRVVPKEVCRVTLFDYFYIVMMLFVELGVSYWGSVASVFSAIFLMRWWKVFARGLGDVPHFVLVVPMMFVSLLIENSNDIGQDAMRMLREAAFLVLMLGFFRGITFFRVDINPKALRRCLRYLSFFLLFACLAQILFIHRGQYVGFPSGWYAQGQNTIPDALALKYTHVRPNVTFSEPSYLAFFLLSLLYMNEAFHRVGGRDRWATAALVLTGVAGESATFVAFFCFLTMISVFREKDFMRARPYVLLGGVVGFAVLVNLGARLLSSSRLSGLGSDSGDFSFFVRIFGPGSALLDYLFNHPFGVPSTKILDALEFYSSQYSIDPAEYAMNQLFNFVFFYGLAGIAIIAVLLRGRPFLFSAFLFSVTFINGSMLAPDKFCVMCFIALIFQYNRFRPLYPERRMAGPAGPVPAMRP